MRSLLMVLTLAVFAIGCTDLGDNVRPFRQEVTLRVGETIVLDNGNLTMMFSEIRSDSRCPPEVVCMWEGDAAIAVLLQARLHDGMTEVLHTNPAVGNGITQYRRYHIALRDLTRPPAPNVRITPEYFVATLLVTAE